MFIIAELFPQYGGDLNIAERMIMECKMGGASAVKLQLYPAALFPGDDGEARAYLELTFEGLKRLKQYADNIGIDLFATPFTGDRLEWCLELDLKYLKIPARMHTENPELVRTILSQGRRTFVSVPPEMDLSSFRIDENAIYLLCIGKYPTRLGEVQIPDFETSIFSGISDHSLGVGAALVTAAHRGRFVEKHYTISTSWQKPTEKAHLGSMTADDLRLLYRLASEIELVVQKEGHI